MNTKTSKNCLQSRKR